MIDWQLLEKRMQTTLEMFEKELSGLRTGRVSPLLLQKVVVDVYGNMNSLLQVAHVSVADSRTLIVSVWDKNLIKSVEKGIRESCLGLNPTVDGTTIRVPVPPLSEERRLELKKVAASSAEKSRVAIRNIRRDFINILKNATEGKDSLTFAESKIQKITDIYIAKLNTLLNLKEKEIMQV